uniref:Uncharacterized protein n=1 Tax=Setaria viridis TaxID=4556 RepID=A0A4U6VMQ7_SETVI|nr:hypothetical protein SEVIR_2G077300v2 [Setaria viridis]
MLRRFWARLRGIQMPGSFLIRRRSVSGEAAELPPAVKKVPGGRRRRRRYRRPRRRQNQAEEPSREPEKKPPPPLLMVDDLPVPEEQKLQYKEYCRARAGYPENVTFCHICFFDKLKYDGGKFPDSKSFLHYSKHEGSHLFCPWKKCLVRVSTHRERQLHIHFCHVEPAGWWDY